MPTPIPLAIATCCRDWQVPIPNKGGKCGLCGETPTFSHMLPESQWITPRPAIKSSTLTTN